MSLSSESLCTYSCSLQVLVEQGRFYRWRPSFSPRPNDWARQNKTRYDTGGWINKQQATPLLCRQIWCFSFITIQKLFCPIKHLLLILYIPIWWYLFISSSKTLLTEFWLGLWNMTSLNWLPVAFSTDFKILLYDILFYSVLFFHSFQLVLLALYFIRFLQAHCNCALKDAM